MIVQESRAEKLARDPEFVRVYKMDISLKAKAAMLKAGAKTVLKAARLARIIKPPAPDLNLAPNDAEEEASVSSLRLAPMVAARAKEVTDLHIAYLNGEIDRFPWDESPSSRLLFVRGKMRGGA